MRHLRHLAARFFDVLRSRALTPDEQARVDGWLREDERSLFWGQQAADQRHAYEAARSCLAEQPDRPDLVRAALLHDVGKRHARLGVVGRVTASLLRLARMPAPGRLGAYLDHGRLGAEELAAGGAEPIVVRFARHHHEAEPPAGVAPEDWVVLRRADGE
jgi:putative nucleotidyltransferase with HDIG domain